jgi:hypothetical protein
MNTLPLQWSVDSNDVSRGAPAVFSYEANSEELVALKRYTEIEDLTSFQAEMKVSALVGGRFRVSGTFRASLIQSSVVDLEAVPSRIEESFSVEYWPPESIADAEGDAVSFDSDPPEAIMRGQLLVGALLCELFAVAIDPYPRNEGDSFEWEPPQQEPEVSPFAGLAHFRTQKDGKQN